MEVLTKIKGRVSSNQSDIAENITSVVDVYQELHPGNYFKVDCPGKKPLPLGQRVWVLVVPRAEGDD